MATSAAAFEVERVQPGVLPPGPRLPALVQFLHLGFRPIAFLEECDRRYGTPFTLRVPARPSLVMFSDPEAIREIFTGDPEPGYAVRTVRRTVTLAPSGGMPVVVERVER